MDEARSLEKKITRPLCLHKYSRKIWRKRKGPLRVFVCGPHGVGKTTLVDKLVNENKQLFKREEIARKYFLERGESAEDVNPAIYPQRFEEFQRNIMDSQCSIEENDEQNKGVIVYDRGPDALVYITKYHPEGDKIRLDMLNKENIKKAIRRYRKSLVLLVYPHESFERNDNVRMDSSFEDIKDLFNCFKRILQELKIPFKVISVSDSDKRLAFAKKFIRNFKRKQSFQYYG